MKVLQLLMLTARIETKREKEPYLMTWKRVNNGLCKFIVVILKHQEWFFWKFTLHNCFGTVICRKQNQPTNPKSIYNMFLSGHERKIHIQPSCIFHFDFEEKLIWFSLFYIYFIMLFAISFTYLQYSFLPFHKLPAFLYIFFFLRMCLSNYT